jgi:histidinol-phosphate aminotransferase
VKQGLGLSGPEVYQACLRKGVIFRPVANYGLPDHLRISIGTPEENRVGLRALSSVGRTA